MQKRIERPPVENEHAEISLPDEVIRCLATGRKIDAIKMLRLGQGIGLKEAKEAVDAYLLSSDPSQLRVPQGSVVAERVSDRRAAWLVPVVVLVAIAWALINSVSLAASLIILANQEGYAEATFTVDKLLYGDDFESGLSWGLEGHIGGKQLRYYAPTLADGKALDRRGLAKAFPSGTELEVWYNEDVTDTLFQHRTLNLVPYSESTALTVAEWATVRWWLQFCLLPLVIAFIIGRAFDNRSGLNGGIRSPRNPGDFS
ncbi:MAG: hypothetical protein JRH01_13750 [Deltaproteobacteria bacterium]|nr:hypothetical protein [Deltaproteobacteria bacterium]